MAISGIDWCGMDRVKNVVEIGEREDVEVKKIDEPR